MEAALDEAMEDVAPTSILTFNLLLIIKRAQAQHGLRHGDYTRYRCRHRLETTSSGGRERGCREPARSRSTDLLAMLSAAPNHHPLPHCNPIARGRRVDYTHRSALRV
jgi:hypothetical protein